MPGNSLWYLENIDVARMLCARKYGNRQSQIHQREYAKGEHFGFLEDDVRHAFVVVSGKVKICSSGSSTCENMTALITAGEVFGVLKPGSTTREEYVYAMEHTTVWILTAGELHALIRHHNGISRTFLRFFRPHHLALEQRLNSLLFKNCRRRIIELLNDQVQQRGKPHSHGYIVRNFLSLRALARRTATSRRTAISVLDELRKKNIIAFDCGQLLVQDPSQLK